VVDDALPLEISFGPGDRRVRRGRSAKCTPLRKKTRRFEVSRIPVLFASAMMEVGEVEKRRVAERPIAAC